MGEVYDPMSAPRTRRSILKAALAGVVLTLPFAGGAVQKARAAGPADCRKGCQWTAGKDFASGRRGCVDTYAGSLLFGCAYVFYLPIAVTAGTLREFECLDRNFLVNKSKMYDCLLPDCPGFDPKKEGGPCDGCRDNCCPCQASENGYICCIFKCDDTDHNCCPA